VAAVSNLLVMHSFAKSPNPGFSLALSSTQVLWVTLAGVIFFSSVVSGLAILGVLFILGGVFLVYVKNYRSN